MATKRQEGQAGVEAPQPLFGLAICFFRHARLLFASTAHSDANRWPITSQSITLKNAAT